MFDSAVEALDVLVGSWKLTVTDAWFLESRDVRQHGRATGRWLGKAFVELVAELQGAQMWHFGPAALADVYQAPGPGTSLLAKAGRISPP